MKAKDNPFRAERLHKLTYQPVDETWPSIMRRLSALHHRAAIIGPHGTGKSTLLDALAQRLAASGMNLHRLFINDTSPAPPMRVIIGMARSLGPRDVMLIDGAERITRRTWAYLKHATHRLGGLIITTHRRGMLPPLVTTRGTPALLHALIDRLPDVQAHELPMSPAMLLDQCRGNVRDALRQLYDHYAAI
ncbi:AAA family ATPase [Planctomycetales bacterium ZRK34]|nr:AAA family ATPase [Planctomycetales bacterium ZRK34]